MIGSKPFLLVVWILEVVLRPRSDVSSTSILLWVMYGVLHAAKKTNLLDEFIDMSLATFTKNSAKKVCVFIFFELLSKRAWYQLHLCSYITIFLGEYIRYTYRYIYLTHLTC